jgi:hypothetical protein
MQISEKSKQGFEAAATKLGLSTDLPDLSILRPDLAQYITAQYMLAVIIEARKDGKVHDITNHDEWKYWPYFYAKEGYVPGSSGGGFSFGDCDGGGGWTTVGARLSSNTREIAKEIAEEFIDLYEIVMLIVQ